MSLHALLKAVRDHVRKECNLQDRECSCQLDGQPPPGIGKRFVSVHPVLWQRGDVNLDRGMDEQYGIDCTITFRPSAMPQDRLMEDVFLDNLRGMEQLARKIAVKVHQNYDIMNAANRLVGGDDPISQPLVWLHTDPAPQPRDASWLWEAERQPPTSAMVLAVHFGDARRMQSHDDME